MKQHLISLLLLLTLWQAADAQQKAQTAARANPANTQQTTKTETLLKQSGYTFEKAGESLWITRVEGKHSKEIALIIAESEGMTILFSLIGEKQADKLTALQMRQLLKLTMALDKVKIGLDDDDNLMVRIDLSTRTMDAEELSAALDQLGAAADETHGILNKK